VRWQCPDARVVIDSAQIRHLKCLISAFPVNCAVHDRDLIGSSERGRWPQTAALLLCSQEFKSTGDCGARIALQVRAC